jgi:hypothetical protein
LQAQVAQLEGGKISIGTEKSALQTEVASNKQLETLQQELNTEKGNASTETTRVLAVLTGLQGTITELRGNNTLHM